MTAEEALSDGVDCAVMATDHDAVDYAEVARQAPLVADTRNYFAL